MNHRSRRLALLTLVLLLALPVSASALEILVLDAGSISDRSPHSLGFLDIDIPGPRLSFSGFGQVTPNTGWGYRFCTGSFGSCAPGSVFPIGGVIGGSEIHGLATLDGVRNVVANNSGPAADALLLAVTGFFPVPPIGGATGAVLTGPFSLTGEFFRGCGFLIKPCDLTPDGTPQTGPSFLLEGHGLYTLSLELVHNPVFGDTWQPTSVEFDLQPTPEPATLILWGTGAAAGLGLVRRQRRSHSA